MWRKLRQPVPLWILLITILVTGVVIAGILAGLGFFSPRPDFVVRMDRTSMPVMVAFDNTTYLSPVINVTLTSSNGYSGIVSLSVAAPPNVDAALYDYNSLNRITNPVVVLGVSAAAYLRVRTSTVGNYTVAVTGASGKLSHTESVLILSQRLIIKSNPDPLPVQRGSSATTTLTITSLNRLSGNLTMYVDGCSGSGCWPGYVQPASVFLPPNGSVLVMATVTVPASVTFVGNTFENLNSHLTLIQGVAPWWDASIYGSFQLLVS